MIHLATAVRGTARDLRTIADHLDELPEMIETGTALAQAKWEYARRRARRRCLPEDVFGEPAWDMMLDLFIARAEQRAVSVSSLCIASDVPATTALRWISILEHKKILERQPDPRDGRRVYLTLTDEASDAMQRYFLA